MGTRSGSTAVDTGLVDLGALAGTPLGQGFLRGIQWMLDPLLRYREINRIYHELLRDNQKGEAGRFFERAMFIMGVRYEVRE